ncbi:hypothetical protein Z517_01520 [Fonsecaea pedrosoi CBS 271.37]|uniref:Cytochrome P450 monooxygenase n=1 Tax=Fonsecaea pedrosoi CBS 271.37 TaxID=1442368 RepID=A0A0D2E7P8_9EURO|nr:uncharacterized protein Z517_01520 [Fonsecaea pedrosoi CBS 271.37]KIW86126.1 hypothetical protein Z517_01520 [Fonsecaea pedrosoi CBS 271.37]
MSFYTYFFVNQPWWKPLAIVLLLSIIYYLANITYYLYFHPLSKYPGNKLDAISRIPHALRCWRGRAPMEMLELHRKYGDIVRVGPQELSFQHPDAWNSISGHRIGTGHGNNEKDPRQHTTSQNNLLGASREKHARFRRALSHGFSSQAIANQQPLINRYIDLLIQRLDERVGQKIDAVAWYNWTTFDIIGDLSLGESFGCLEQARAHFWVTTFFESVRFFNYSRLLGIFPELTPLLRFLISEETVRVAKARMEITTQTVERRQASGRNRPDYIDALMTTKDGVEPLTQTEIIENAALVLIAGSETTATALSGATYLLCKHPRVLKKLQDEVRSAFMTESEINLDNVSRLPYTMAVIKEVLRIYPPTPMSNSRVTPPEGNVICGEPLPGNTYLNIFQWTSHHNPKYFADPDLFVPERFLGTDPRYANDNLAMMEPFSVGPRNCIGKNLAYVEMRLILARIVFNFDFELAPESDGWMEGQIINTLWEKPPLYITMSARKQG